MTKKLWNLRNFTTNLSTGPNLEHRHFFEVFVLFTKNVRRKEKSQEVKV